MAAITRKPLGQMLLELDVIDEDQLNAALDEHKRRRHPLGRTLVDLGLVDEETIVRALSHQLKLPAVQLDGFTADANALALLDGEFCREHACFPLRYQEDRRVLHIAMADHNLYDTVRVRARCNLRPYLAGPVAIDRAVRRTYFFEEEGTPGFRPDERLLDLEENKRASGVTQDPTHYYDLNERRGAAPSAGPAAPSEAKPTAITSRRRLTLETMAGTGDANIEQLRLELVHMRNIISRMAELLVAKGICLPDEVTDFVRE